jgi:hypothetical protein
MTSLTDTACPSLHPLTEAVRLTARLAEVESTLFSVQLAVWWALRQHRIHAQERQRRLEQWAQGVASKRAIDADDTLTDELLSRQRAIQATLATTWTAQESAC